MIKTFYTASQGAKAGQAKMDSVAANISNISTTGYKSGSIPFSSLLYQTQANVAAQDNGRKMAENINISLDQGNLQPTERALDYAIDGAGFFALQDPISGKSYYTRNGSFQASVQQDGSTVLAAANGWQVLDQNGKAIPLTENTATTPGVFQFNYPERLMRAPDSSFIAEGQEAFLAANAKVRAGWLELSNTSFASEMSKIIETQRIYQGNVRMLQTTDEITQLINALRG